MATRRRGAASLDDLKARLGYTEPTEPTGDEPTQVSETAPDEAVTEDESSGESTSTGNVEVASESSVDSALFDEDYSEAVTEDDGSFEYDPNQVDGDIKAPASKTLLATILAASASLLLGLAIGVIGTANNTARALENASTADSGVLLEALRPIAATLTTLDGDLSTVAAETTYTPSFETRLRETFTGGELPVLNANLVSAATTLMVINDQLGTALVDYSVATSFLASAVERHLRATALDAEEIAALQAGTEDTTNYGIAIEFETLLTRFQAFIEDADANPFSPIAAERITYENLEMTVEGDGDEQREFYTVTTATGETINVLIHDLVLMPREQLLPPISSENALDRYRARSAQIKEVLAQITSMNADLLTELEDLADNQVYFTF